MTDRPHLYLVPYRAPTVKQRVRAKVKRMPKPDGTLQCSECGGRAVLSIYGGVMVKNGKRSRGTVIIKDVCAICWKRGVTVDMKPDPPPPKQVT